MRRFLALLLRCVLVLGLGFTPVANALNMAALDSTQAPESDCHAPCHKQHHPGHKCCTSTAHCHCATANALPVALPIPATPRPLSDHPQTVHLLTLQQTVTPDTPPPRRVA